MSHSAVQDSGGTVPTGGGTVVFRLLKVTATGGFLFYLAWNIRLLGQGRIPPSIFLAVTGLPCPTTGGSRSCAALLRGDLAASLSFNAMMLPIVALLGITIGELAFKRFRHRPLVISRALAWSWPAVLTLAWVLKLADALAIS
jgi:hypothetical protein